MKRLLLYLLFGSSLQLLQAQPIAEANTYIYKDADGVSGFNHVHFLLQPNGKIFQVPYIGGSVPSLRYNTGNTFIYAPSKSSNLFLYLPLPNGTALLANDQCVHTLVADTVTKTFYIPKSVYPTIAGSRLFYLYDSAYYYFEHNSLVALPWIPYFKGLKYWRFLSNENNEIWAVGYKNDSIRIYKIDNTSLTPQYKKAYPYGEQEYYKQSMVAIKDENNFLLMSPICSQYTLYQNGQKYLSPLGNGLDYHVTPELSPYIIKTETGNFFSIRNIFNTTAPVFYESAENLSNSSMQHEANYGSFIISTGNKPVRIFPHIQKYPRLFNHSNSASIFALREDDKGRIWAGSYSGALSIINKDKLTELPYHKAMWMNGGSFYKGKMYLIGEGTEGIKSIDVTGNITHGLSGKMTGFYTYIDIKQNEMYYGTTAFKGLWHTSMANLSAGHPVWEKIDSTKGSKLENILTITADTLGCIWYAHPGSGIAVYNTVTHSARTWLRRNGECKFGVMASLTDAHGTVWLGGHQGLWYYNNYKLPATPQSCKQIIHPFLMDGKLITALTVCKGWLVIAAYDKILAFDLNTFYASGKIIVRYLNPQESSFTSFTEQNTMITTQDSSVWFSTSDMLYHWDFSTWLALPQYKVATTAWLISHNKTIELSTAQKTILPASFTSFDIQARLLSPDNMPRYMQVALIKEGDTTALPIPSLETNLPIKNISSGNYTFELTIFEQDGNINHYSYPIFIKKFLWQYWWFWALIFMPFIVTLFLLMNTRRHKAVLEKEKAMQEKRLANLQMITLSNQFRPHFILNALNTIGAQMDDRPEAETVLSRLGESINLIFNHTQQQTIAHSFANEWMLVKNIIHIHQLMYLKKLETSVPPPSVIDKYGALKIPLGLLQIPVENALLHGLSNRVEKPWLLTIEITEDEKNVIVSITDNGVGRATAATLSNYQKHGTGTKNLAGILEIVNAKNIDKITIAYQDGIFAEGAWVYGTKVMISIPKQFIYED